MKRLVLMFVALLALSGCATVGEKALEAGTTGSIRFTAEDVDQAIAIAQASKDAVAEGCYRAIRKHVGEEAAAPNTDVKGVVSAYAKARSTARALQSQLDNEVHVACAPLVVDAAQFGAQLGKTLGEGIVLGGFKIPLPPIKLPAMPLPGAPK